VARRRRDRRARTNEPQRIPGRPSHGCIRMPNRKIRQLVRRMKIGTPLEIR
jgi:lipoprotein-anchoring transpeptidase ErfK/SrfK